GPSTFPWIARSGDAPDSARLNLRPAPSLVLGVATAVFVIILLGMLSWVSLADQYKTREDTMATLNMDSAVNAVLAGITSAETGQRGYLITRTEGFLEPFI